ncbi:MAG: alpha/beta fold hydrolase [Gemmatimonadaceae bacterium]
MAPFSAAWWLPGAHAQTLWGRVARRGLNVDTRRERWETLDGDFVDVHRLSAPTGAPRLVLFHGLEGTVNSHYVRGMLAEARRRGWGAELLVFRSCGSDANRTLRFYHSGETGDAAFVVARVAADHPTSPLLLVGVSLGGNVLLKWLGECGNEPPAAVRAAAVVSVPYDLARGARYLERGFARLYQEWFLRSLRRKALDKLARFPGYASAETIRRARTLHDFDDTVTAPVHGFRDADEYYARSSALGFLSGIRVPTLLLSAADDPFLPREVLVEVQRAADGNPALTLEVTSEGGHVGFVGGRVPWRAVYYAERRVGDFLAATLSGAPLGTAAPSMAGRG